MSYANGDVAALRFTVAMDAAASPAATSMVWSLGSRDWPATHTERGAVKINLASGGCASAANTAKQDPTLTDSFAIAMVGL